MNLYTRLWRSLTPRYAEGEARAIVSLLVEGLHSLSLADVCCGALDRLPPDSLRQTDEAMRRLAAGEPVQHVLGWAEFAGRRFKVSPDVLIPRPETEDLCTLVADRLGTRLLPHPALLDIGTGSGCIAVTLAKSLPGARVAAWDISPQAAAVARHNADSLGADIDITVADALNPPDDNGQWDAIVSNPPYICLSEKDAMEPNVIDYEPHTALFVPDSDPLLFYRSIARYAAKALRPQGGLYFEINPLYRDQLHQELASLGFTAIATADDRYGRKRLTYALLP